MSVFSGARIDAIEEVIAGVGDGLDVVDVLTSLVDKSLVRSVAAGGSHRFTMLQRSGTSPTRSCRRARSSARR